MNNKIVRKKSLITRLISATPFSLSFHTIFRMNASLSNKYLSLQNLLKYSIIIFDKIDYELNNILCRRVALNLFTSGVKTTPPQKKVAGIVLERGRTTHFSTIARAQRWSMDKHASSSRKRKNGGTSSSNSRLEGGGDRPIKKAFDLEAG